MKQTLHDYLGYVFTISYQPAEPIFSVDFADFPEIITSGDSLAEAFTNACEALDLHLEKLAQARPPRAQAEASLARGVAITRGGAGRTGR